MVNWIISGCFELNNSDNLKDFIKINKFPLFNKLFNIKTGPTGPIRQK